MEAFEAHYDEVLNQAAREEEEQGEEAQLRAEQRQQKRRQVVEKVKAHMARLDSGAVEKAMAGMDMTAILTEKNIEAAIKELKKGTVPGRDGLGIDFYAKRCVRAKLIAHLRRHFLATLTDGMPDAMKEAVISVLYKGRGKDPLECKSFRPISVTRTPLPGHPRAMARRPAPRRLVV